MDYLFMKGVTGRLLRDFSAYFMFGLALAGCAQHPPGTAQAASRRVIRLIVGVSAGGGQDLYARVVAPHLGKHLPGQPRVVVENMPGAGGLIAASYVARRTQPDTLTLGLFSVQSVLAQLLDQTPNFDVRDMPIVGSPSGDGIVCAFSRASGFTLDSWRAGRVPRFGMTNRGSTTAAYAQLISAALELPMRPVLGYSGTAEIRAALAGSEVDGVCMSRSSFIAVSQPVEEYVPVLHVGIENRDAPAGAVPAMSLATSDRARALLGAAASMSQLARYIVAPPGTAGDEVAMLRAAFEQTVSDPAFLASARAARIEVQPRSARDVEADVRRVLELPPDLRREVIAVLSQGAF
jgi:tripartite-type tricarboxylate transporter receptor subunit TctC